MLPGKNPALGGGKEPKPKTNNESANLDKQKSKNIQIFSTLNLKINWRKIKLFLD